MSAHTPGPWHAFYKAKYDEWHVSVQVSDSHTMRQWLFSDGIPTKNEFDARLIAAAPDLLEALKTVVRVIEANPPSIVDTIWARGYETLLDHCSAAIAKAEGKQP